MCDRSEKAQISDKERVERCSREALAFPGGVGLSQEMEFPTTDMSDKTISALSCRTTWQPDCHFLGRLIFSDDRAVQKRRCSPPERTTRPRLAGDRPFWLGSVGSCLLRLTFCLQPCSNKRRRVATTKQSAKTVTTFRLEIPGPYPLRHSALVWHIKRHWSDCPHYAMTRASTSIVPYNQILSCLPSFIHPID